MQYLYVSLFVFCLFQLTSHAQSSLDSLIGVQNDSIWNVRSYEALDAFYPSSHHLLQRALKARNPSTIAKAYQNLADWHSYRESPTIPDSSFLYEQQALETLLSTVDSLAIAKAYSRIADSHIFRNEYDQAQQYYLQSLQIAERNGFTEGLARSHSDLAFLYREMKLYDKAIAYGNRAIRSYIALGDDYSVGVNSFYMIPTYLETGALDTALVRANQSVEVLEAMNEPLENNGALQRAYGLRGDVYIEKQQYYAALDDYLYARKLAVEFATDSLEASPRALSGIGKAYRYLDNCERAIPYLERFKQAFIAAGNSHFKEMVEVYHDLAHCYEAERQLDSALVNHKLAYNLNDSLATDSYQALRTELGEKYETEKKNEQISLQRATIEQQQQIQGLTIGIAILLGLLLLGLYFFYVRNQKNNRLLANLNTNLTKKNAQNELLVKEIHHRVKNNLQVLSSLLYLQSHHTKDAVAGDALREGQNRVQAMGLIHQKLYTTNDLTTVDMDTYTRDLTETLIDALGANPQQIEVNYQIQDLQLDVDTAIPLGLILNELITNSIKYAFAHAQSGELKISLFTNDRAHLVLQVKNKTDESYPTHQQTMGTGFGSNLIHILGQKMQGTPVITQTENSYQTEIVFQRWQQSTPESFATTAP